MREWIARALWSGAAALGLAILSGLLSLVLLALGDRTGAESVRGVTLVTLFVFTLDIVVLVVLLAACELRRSDPNNGNK